MKYKDKSTKIGRYTQLWIANKSAKFHTKGLNRSEYIPKSFRGGAYFYRNTRYVLHMVLRAHSVIYNMYDSSTYKNIRKWQMNAQ